MDINLPDINKFDPTREILKQCPCTFVAAISIDTSTDVTERAQAAGAVQLIGKDELFISLFPQVGAAVTLANWTKGLQSHFPIADESRLYATHSLAHMYEGGVLLVGQNCRV